VANAVSATKARQVAVLEEDELRAQVYRLLANLLRKAPEEGELKLISGLSGDESALGSAFQKIAKTAGNSSAPDISDQFDQIFVGVGRGELLPYASYYLTGFLHEKPLAKLRTDMAELGVARGNNVSEPEDHIAALCEMMAGLILGDFGEVVPLQRQKEFFARHVESWAKLFFEDLAATNSSKFYGAVGEVGAAFIDIETDAFRMIES